MDDQHPEIVIIRRGGHGDHDEHHGGVWKIAFADFMTAMMAFFLVMWLISANDKTRASVARYFNPVRLVDATTQPRGLHDSKKDDSGITSTPDTKDSKTDQKAEDSDKAKATGRAAAETANGKNKRLDAELRDNPYVALAEIAGEKGPGAPTNKDGAAPIPAIGQGGPAFRDPFAPPPRAATRLDAKDDANDPPAPAVTRHPAAPEVEKTDEDAKATDIAQKQIDALTSNISTALKGLIPDHNGPAIDVRKTSEGTLLSLTDTANYTMFANGSAVPAKRVVEMMATIAPLLKDKPGVIVIRGFTDTKKFKGTRYDNWHLSIDRAQVAHYMLVRGGLADDRISHVEGYADHETRPGLAGENPGNRRIEILLKDPPA